jgi:hypothetical protein
VWDALNYYFVKTKGVGFLFSSFTAIFADLKIRKIISLFLLLVLCAQLLPLRQTIAWLLGGQATEELVHADGSDAGRPGDDLQKSFLPVYSPTLIQWTLQNSARTAPATAVELPSRHADDIPTPPPNC